MLVGELDEDVFKAGSERANLCDRNAVFHELFAEIVEIETVFDERMDGLPEKWWRCVCRGGDARIEERA